LHARHHLPDGRAESYFCVNRHDLERRFHCYIAGDITVANSFVAKRHAY
jgi:hypothetical protein